jgi:hypothetical protein
MEAVQAAQTAEETRSAQMAPAGSAAAKATQTAYLDKNVATMRVSASHVQGMPNAKKTNFAMVDYVANDPKWAKRAMKRPSPVNKDSPASP